MNFKLNILAIFFFLLSEDAFRKNNLKLIIYIEVFYNQKKINFVSLVKLEN